MRLSRTIARAGLCAAVVVLLAPLPGNASAGRGAAAAPACPTTTGIKPLIRGLVDRTVIPPAQYLQAATIEVKWSDIEPIQGAPLNTATIDNAIAANCSTPLRLRVQAGIAAPDWAKGLDGGPVNVINPFGMTPGTIGKFWMPDFGAAYDNLQAELAHLYDSASNLDEVVVSRCSMFYPEPFLRAISVPSNISSLINANYTVALDQQCQKEEIDSSVNHWTRTRVGVSFNPYQVINPDGTHPIDENFTEQVMGYCRLTAGPRCVLENDSIRDPISNLPSQYSQMYSVMSHTATKLHVSVFGVTGDVMLGPPLAFQTAVMGDTAIHDFWGTLVWARKQHAASVELPIDPTYPTSGTLPWQTIAEVAKWFQEDPSLTANPVAATEGAATTGIGLAVLNLDEFAASDTIAGYGDVGSVPFDSVSATVGWPDGASEPALLTTGQGPPAASVTCSQSPCQVTIQSGGHRSAEEAPATPAAVNVSLVAGAPYVPADGILAAAAPAVTVTDQPLDASASAYTFTAQAQAGFSGLIGSFHDENELAMPTDAAGHEYSVSIDWGDGSAVDTSTGVYVIGTCGASPGPAAGQGCPVDVSGGHTYANSGTYSVMTTVRDGASANLTFNSTAKIAPSSSACTAAGLKADKPSPQGTGTIITFTASASPCPNPEFKFYVQASGGRWILARGYGGPIYLWNTAGDGATSYNFDVWVREKGSTASQQASFVMPYSLSPSPACAAANLVASPASPQPSGTTVTFTATSSICSQPQYQFYVQASGGPWILGRAYGSDTYVWKTKGDARTMYNIDVWVRQNGAKAAYQTFKVIPYRLS